MEPTKFDMKYAAVRRAIIEQRFSKLNDKQRKAVYQTEGPQTQTAQQSLRCTVCSDHSDHCGHFLRCAGDPFDCRKRSQQQQRAGVSGGQHECI